MSKKSLAAIMCAAVVLAGVSLEAGAVDLGISNNLNLPTAVTVPAVQTPAVQPRASLAENRTNEEMYSVVKRIGDKILQANNITANVNFVLVVTEDVNATTDMENTVRVYTGLLEQCKTEDELASIIGHEIGHAVKSHVIKGVVVDAVANTGTTVAKNIATKHIATSHLNRNLTKFGFAGDMLTNVASGAIDKTSTAATSKLQRGREVDADELGIDYMVKAGYNPMASIDVMLRIGDNYNDFFADHPSTDKRVEAMRAYINEKYPQFSTQKSYY